MNTNAAQQAYGITRFGADFDGHNDSVRGITEQDGIYTAFGKTFSRDFKTLAGAARYMVRMGYNADGSRI